MIKLKYLTRSDERIREKGYLMCGGENVKSSQVVCLVLAKFKEGGRRGEKEAKWR